MQRLLRLEVPLDIAHVGGPELDDFGGGRVVGVYLLCRVKERGGGGKGRGKRSV